MEKGRRSMSWSPPKWSAQSLRVEDVKRCLEAAKRLGGLTTQSSDSEINGYQLQDHNAALRPVKLEATSAEPQMDRDASGEHLHGSEWQDPICSLFQKKSEWQDPTCTLFQTKNLATYQAENPRTGGSYSQATPPETPFKGSDASSRRVSLKNGGCVDYAVKEKELSGASKSSQDRHRENVFRDMGFPPALIQRAIHVHGAQADDSKILQFLLDWRENNDVRGASCKKQADQSEFKLVKKATKGTEENVSGSLTVRQQIANSMRENGVVDLWESDESNYSDSDFNNDEEEAILPTSRSPIDWAEERRSDFPVTLVKRELPAGEDHRLLMRNHGFPAELIESAIQELGEGVEYDMLLEYLLYLTAQENQKASTSASLEKRSSTAKKVVNECGYPTNHQPSRRKQVNTVEKLVAECGFPAKAVGRAMAICETPMWDAGQDQLADLVDFLTAHRGELDESEDDAKEDEGGDPQEDTDWSWLRQHVVEDASSKGKRKLGYGGVARRKTINRLSRPPHMEEDGRTSNMGKRKQVGYGGVARRKAVNPLSRPSTLKREQLDYPPLHRPTNVKLEQLDELEESDEPSRNRRRNLKQEQFDDLEECDEPPLRRRPRVKRQYFDQSLLNKRQPSARVPRVKLVVPQRRNASVGRIGRPQIIKEEVPKALDRHHGSVGFGLPGFPVQPRYLDEDVKGAPFFYFENVASMPNDEWERIRRHLFDIEPEFVDSLHFSACRRPRGYIHNLPIEGRRKILADPPMTIQELLPHTRDFWPTWDPRTKLNCITTRMGSEFLIKKLQIGDGTSLQTADPSPDQQREILHLCRHWNLVWTAPNIPTPIDEIEIEAMLGFDSGHSRNILSNRSRYKALGNSFSVFTVAFHFSVLKPLYPRGIKVLSLFSGIGGAEVALHKMGIKLLVVVSVEIDDGTRRCLEAWWAASKQTGVLNQNYHNIKDLGRAQISELVNVYGGFDLIVGGTPCNNLSGSNHVTRVGLDGKQSTVFFEFSRVVAAVRELTIRLQQKK
ncbi:hypothetical protein M758_7G128100 [Ceratodon purpureus]|nr:hypothetical protein M758_7G128100 [Ceratodon purpureus]